MTTKKSKKNLTHIFKNIFSQKHLIIFSFLILFGIFQVGCSSTIELKSNWLDREIKVDGKSDEWVGAMAYFESQNISVGVLNDNDFIYICMIADEPQIRSQVIGRGLMLWFDPEGGSKKSFGIKYPVGIQMEGGFQRPGAEGRREDFQDRDKRMQELLEDSSSELEILASGRKEGKRMFVEEARGLEVKLAAYSGMIVYECKIPFSPSDEYPYAVGTKAGDMIGIGIETPEIDLNAMRDEMGDRMPPGGGGGRGMPPGGSMGGGRGGRQGGMGMGGRGRRMPTQLKVWTVVQLASESEGDE